MVGQYKDTARAVTAMIKYMIPAPLYLATDVYELLANSIGITLILSTQFIKIHLPNSKWWIVAISARDWFDNIITNEYSIRNW
jgi:hypothetical protein